MRNVINNFLARLRDLRQKEDGTATIEFAIVFPIIMTMFLAAFEVGLLMTRQVTLERAVDMTIRDLRLGNIVAPTQDSLRARICANARIIPECMTNLMIEMRPIDTNTWTPLGTDVTCKERSEDLDPLVSLNPGVQHELILVRVCSVIEPWFPTTKLGVALHNDTLGGYALAASSAFVNEPS